MDDRQITELNDTYLRRNRPTDVIAFSQIEGDFCHINTRLLGDVVISLETAKRQAEELNIPLREEIVFLLVHGTLHLIGYDHVGSASNARKMKAKENKLMRTLTRFL